jgi:hypothetical protein
MFKERWKLEKRQEFCVFVVVGNCNKLVKLGLLNIP